MNLQMATRHALFAILELAADPDRQISAAEIAEKYGISLNHLSKVMRTLGRNGLVEAVRGVGGGYRFIGNARRVTLLDIISAFEQVGKPAASHREPGDDTAEGRAMRMVTEEIDIMTQATLSSITVDTMLKMIRRVQRDHAAGDRGPQSS